MSDDLSIPNPGYRGGRPGRYGGYQRQPQRKMDPETRRLMMFAAALGGILVVLVGASALIDRHSGGIPVVNAPAGPTKVRPPNEGGMKIDGAENAVFSGSEDTHNVHLGPAAETPDTQALRADELAAEQAAKAKAAAAISAAQAAKPAAAEAARTGKPEPASAVHRTAEAPASHAHDARATPAQLAAAHRAEVEAAAKRAQAEAARQERLKAARIDAARIDAARIEAAQREKQAAARQQQIAARHATPSVATTAGGHVVTVQLAALGSEAAAHAEWADLQRRMPGLLSGRQPIYQHVSYGGHTFWRVRTGGFGDMAQARHFCAAVRAKGGGCSVADF